MTISITGWGAFWLSIGLIGIVGLITDAIIKTSQVRQIVKLLDKAIEAGISDNDENEKLTDSVRNLVDKLNK